MEFRIDSKVTIGESRDSRGNLYHLINNTAQKMVPIVLKTLTLKLNQWRRSGLDTFCAGRALATSQSSVLSVITNCVLCLWSLGFLPDGALQ